MTSIRVIAKGFENKVKENLTSENTLVYRIPDQVTHFKGSTNIADFMIFKTPNLYYLECKSTHEKTFYLKSDHFKRQVEGLCEKSKIQGIYSGILIWYVNFGKVGYVEADYMRELINDKAIGIQFNEFGSGYLKDIPVVVKRTYPVFNGSELLHTMVTAYR
jgi:Holliday junction resolvase